MLRHLYRRYADRVDARILGVFAAFAGGLFAFSKLASEVSEGETADLDRAVLTGLRSAADPSVPVGPAWLRAAMVDLTALGGATVVTAVTLLVVGYLLAARKARTALFVAGAVGVGALASTALKWAFDRPRPDVVEHLVRVHSTSFPSGHAMMSAVVYLTLGALLARAHTERRVKVYLLGAAIALALTVGASRVYLGVHWPTDVVAGWTVGAVWAGLMSLVAQRLQRERAIDPPTDGGDATIEPA